MQLTKTAQLTKAAYYADFVIYPGLLTGIAAIAVMRNDPSHLETWLLAVAAGVAIWTLIEYLLHRFVLHRVAPFSGMHDMHHAAPRAFVGTPTWMSLGVVTLAVFLPTWFASSLNVASGLAAGVMGGFLWYGLVHHAIHYRQPRVLASRLPAASRRHFVHHYAKRPGNFGVTTAFWDHVFGTVLPDPSRQRGGE